MHITIWFTLEIRRNGTVVIVVCHSAKILVPNIRAEKG